MEMKTIMVPVNGSVAGEHSVALACSLAKRVRGKVYVIYIIEVKWALPLDAEIDTEIAQGERILSRAERIAEESDYEVETALLQAREVGPAIVDEAVERGVDVILMGIPIKTRFGQFDLGRTVPYILKNAPCQVWVCREAVSRSLESMDMGVGGLSRDR